MDGKQLDQLIAEKKALNEEGAYLGNIVKLKELDSYRVYLDGIRKRQKAVTAQILASDELGASEQKTAVISRIKAQYGVYSYELDMIDGAEERMKQIRDRLKQISEKVRKITTVKDLSGGIVPPKVESGT